MAEDLPQLRRRHQALAARLSQVGFAVSGSLTRRYTRCGKPGCRCQASPPQPHGPYYQLTRKVAGKTVTTRLTARARLPATPNGSPTSTSCAACSPRWNRSPRQAAELILSEPPETG